MSPNSTCLGPGNKEAENLSDCSRISETAKRGVQEQTIPFADLHHQLNSQQHWVLCNRKIVKPGNWNENICDDSEIRISVTCIPQTLSLYGLHVPWLDKPGRSSRDNLAQGKGIRSLDWLLKPETGRHGTVF